tara:strand:- start:6070 stop:6381 length:312 start_codon:yes stop_codon:yes gene_type:complete
MKYFRIFIIFNIILLNYSCGTIKEGFKNQKKNSSDEFLVEKKSPLVMPPDYGELTAPSIDSNTSKADENKIRELVKQKNIDENESIKEDVSFEDSLIKKIRKK